MSADLQAALLAARAGGDMAGVLDAIPYARFLGLEADRHGDELTFRMPYRDDLIGNFLLPALHGGSIAAMMEIAATVQLGVDYECAVAPRPIDVTVDYFRTGHPRDTFARARVMKPGRRVSNVRVEAWQDMRAKPIAALHGHFLVGRGDGPRERTERET